MKFNIDKEDFKSWIRSLTDDYDFNDSTGRVLCNCPIARYMTKTVGLRCKIGTTTIQICNDVWELPEWATTFIDTYDQAHVGKTGMGKSAKAVVDELEKAGKI